MRRRSILRRGATYGVVAIALIASFQGCATAETGASGFPPGGDPVDASDANDSSSDVFIAPDSPDAADAMEEPEASSPCYPDQDQDGIPDALEGKAASKDTDGDGTPDYEDLDSDGDTIPDKVEGDTANAGCLTPQDSDGDGVPDFQDLDSDGNGLPDALEANPDGSPYDAAKGLSDVDGDTWPDYADPDNDNDGLGDVTELVQGQAIDTDLDGKPDLDDTDSDGDGIVDSYEGASDPDADSVPNFRDLDSDGDTVPDACEAGLGYQVGAPPDDTDSDGKFDFLDRDTDGDGVLDGDEDTNANCVYEMALGETDRRYPDSDSDTVSDLIERALGSDPNDPMSTPETIGKFYFLMPYQEPSAPPQRLVPVDTGLQRADVGFFLDTTGTMGEEIAALRSGLQTIVPSIRAEVPDVGFGVAAHDDYPTDPYGVSGVDLPFYLPSLQGRVSKDPADAIAALGVVTLHNGGDPAAESQIAGMHRGLTNLPLQWPGTILQPDSIPYGTQGSIAFRKSAMPILIEVSDGAMHNGRRANAPGALHDEYSFNLQAPYAAPTADTLVSAMNSVGARFVGLASDDGARFGDPYEDMAWIADNTNSVVPMSAFGGATCNTGLAGLPLNAPDGPGGTCRLVFDIKKNGVGVTDRVVDAVKALVRSLVMDVRIVALSDAPSASNAWTDSVDVFVDSVEVNASGGDDPVAPLKPCVILPLSSVLDQWEGPKGMAPGADFYYDTVTGVKATTKICYALRVKDNTTIPPGDQIQVFHAVLQVRAKNGSSSAELDFGPPRDVIFLVPALPQ